MRDSTRRRLRSDLDDLAGQGLGVRDFSLGAARALRRAVPFDGVCVLAMDPASHLPTHAVIENGLPEATTPRMTEIEFGEPDFNKFGALARAARPAATLSAATDGDLDRSLRHRELRAPNGLGDELRAALVGDAATWGGLTLLRGADSRRFEPEDTEVVGSVAGRLADGLRRSALAAALAGGGAGPGGRGESGVLLVTGDGDLDGADPAGERWLADLRAAAGTAGDRLPPVLAAVASQAAAGRRGPAAQARVLTSTGCWLVVRGTSVGVGPSARTVVTLDLATAPDLAPLVATAFDLTPRERAVTELVALGLSTADIGRRLHLSAWTVQDHLKAIFAKAGVNTRGELVARVFFERRPPPLDG